MMTLLHCILVLHLLFQLVKGDYKDSNGVCTKCHCDNITNTATVVNVTCFKLELQSIPTLPNSIQSLDMYKNNLTNVGENDFSGCVHLRFLNLINNKINCIHEHAFIDTPELEHLHLGENQLNLNINQSDSLPYGILNKLTKLRTLTYNNNKQPDSYRGDLFANKPNLTDLALDGIENISLSEDFAQLTNLRSLGLCGDIAKLENNTFAVLAKIPLERLDMCGRHLVSIERGAFLPLHNLTLLDLSGNDLHLFQSQHHLPIFPETLKKLYLRRVSGKFDATTCNITKSLFIDLTKTNLEELYLDENGIKHIETKTLNSSLQKLSLRFNRLADFSSIHLDLTLPFYGKLKHLDISQQARFPQRPNVYMTEKENISITLTPQLNTLLCAYALAGSFETLKNLQVKDMGNMTVLDLSGNRLGSMLKRVKIYLHPSKNRTIDLLNLTDCHIKEIGPNVVPLDIMINTLDLSWNNLGKFFYNDTNGTSLKSIETAGVKTLNISHNNIKYLFSNFLMHGTKLETIILRDNALNAWAPDVFNMNKLRYLDLSFNSLLEITSTYRIEFSKLINSSKPHLRINLAQNPFQLHCESLGFFHWLRSINGSLNDTRDYVFYLGDGHSKWYNNISHDYLNSLTMICQSSLWITWTGVSVALLIVCIFLSVWLFRHRWDIRYFCLKITRERKEYLALLDNRSYEYDAFVVYHQDDISWVIHALIPQLETPPRSYKLIIHQRDFLPGATIEENITRSIEKSRKTLIILSKNSLRSQWCDFEIQMARMKGIEEGEEIIIVIALETIPFKDLNTTLKNLRRSNTWLEWPELQEERDHFWEQLNEALSHPNRPSDAV